MEHRDKRPPCDETENPIYSPADSTPIPMAPAVQNADADITAHTVTTHDAPSGPNTDTSMQASPEATRTPDKTTWQGWAEIENDPVCHYLQVLDYLFRPFPYLRQIIFNVMLREWGVRGIQVNEVVPIDAIFDSSPSSTFGLIFLSRYSTNNKEKQDVAIPQGLWFANQVRRTTFCITH